MGGFLGEKRYSYKWVFPKIGVYTPKWMVKIMENPIKIDDLGVPLFLETSTWSYSNVITGKTGVISPL